MKNHKLMRNASKQGVTLFTTADLTQALTVYEAVYIEIGMKAGARLLFQLLHTDDETPVEAAQESE